jgi:hypothetical protein
MILLTLVIVIYAILTIYVYPNHGQRIKLLMSWDHNKNNATQMEKGQNELHETSKLTSNDTKCLITLDLQ